MQTYSKHLAAADKDVNMMQMCCKRTGMGVTASTAGMIAIDTVEIAAVDELSRRILMAALSRKKRKIEAPKEAKLRNGLCMHEGCQRPMDSRGCCSHHINLFWSRMRSLRTEAERRIFEQKCIKEGLILDVGEVRKYRRNDPFSRVG